MPEWNVWVTTKMGFERLVRVKARTSRSAKKKAEKKVGKGSEARMADRVGGRGILAETFESASRALAREAGVGVEMIERHDPEFYRGHLR